MRGNLADLAATGLASEPTLRKWISAQPDQTWIIKRGSNGDAYEIDLEGAVQAFRGEEQAKLDALRQRAEDVRQLGLELGLGVSADAAPGLSIAERKQLLEEEFVAIKLAEKRRELVSRSEMEAAIGDILMRFRQRGATFAARLAKRVDLTRDQLTAIERLALADQAELATMMEKWRVNLGDGSDDSAAEVDDTALYNGG